MLIIRDARDEKQESLQIKKTTDVHFLFRLINGYFNFRSGYTVNKHYQDLES